MAVIEFKKKNNTQTKTHKKQPVGPKDIPSQNQSGNMKWAGNGQVPARESPSQGALSKWPSMDHAVAKLALLHPFSPRPP